MPQFKPVTSTEDLINYLKIIKAYAVDLEKKNALLSYGLRAAQARLTDGRQYNEMLDTPTNTIQLLECVLAHADCGFDEIYVTEAA